jgi:hypothetical protein
VSEHFTSPELNKLHDDSVVKNNTEGGACLVGHEASFRKKKNKKTCNYRYQAFEQAKAESKIRTRLETYSWSGPVTTSIYQTAAGGWAPSYYCSELPQPGENDWHLDGPPAPIKRTSKANSEIKIPTGMNFSQDTWPYWNNAHHLIPKGLFNSMITDQPNPVPDVMRKALMKVKYNINHKINMFLLPQDKHVAEILHLTRHIQLRHDDAPYVSEIFTDHPMYNRMVKKKLNSVIATYKAKCDEAKPEEHEIPNAELDKKKLEDLSDTLMNTILGWGMSEAGASLDKMAQLVAADI